MLLPVSIYAEKTMARDQKTSVEQANDNAPIPLNDQIRPIQLITWEKRKWTDYIPGIGNHIWTKIYIYRNTKTDILFRGRHDITDR